ncbi:MAG TPA: hypothetical protein VH541_02055 [Gaiellaceae bacterium]
MSTPSQHHLPDPTAGSPWRWPPRRVASLLVGLVLVVGSAGMICAGAVAAWARTGGTYVDLGAHGSYHTDRYGLASDSTNWQTQLFGWAGSVRLKVASASPKPIFVGVAAADAINRYLSGTAYTTVDELTGRGVARTDHDGAAPAIPPSKAVDWTAQTEGVGTQTLRWDATDRPQVVFAMNADASRPVRVQVVSSAVTLDRMPLWVPAGALALGIILLPLGVVMLQRTRHAAKTGLIARRGGGVVLGER